MKYRLLGNTNVKLSAIGLGCMGMSEFYGPADEKESMKVLHRAVDLGINFFDTADSYAAGKNEELVGKALKPYRDQVIIASKFGIQRDPNNVQARIICGTPEYVREACDASLKHLGLEQIDLYYQHRIDPNVPIEETFGAMAELVKEGKVKYLGVSEASPDTIRRANQVHPLSAVQMEYSLWSRDPEDLIIPLCEELGITFVAYSPIGRGFLTGAIKSPEDLAADDFRRNLPRFQGENFKTNLKLVDAVKSLADAKGCSPSQLALAWVLAQSDRIVPIPGTKRIKYLEENTAAYNIDLSDKDLKSLDDLCKEVGVSGTRYTAFGMTLLGL